jgi:hypothetical protein
MALDTSNVMQVTVSGRFWEGMILPRQDWTKVFKIHRDDEASLRIPALTGVGNIPTWNGTADLTTAAVDSTGATTMAYAARGLQVVIDKYDTKDVPGIVEMAATKLGVSVGATYSTLAWAILGNAFSSETVADTKALCATDHTTATTTRSNSGTSALDRTALEAAITAMRSWVNYQDQPYDLASYQLYLVVPNGLEFTAHQIVASMYTSSQMQVSKLSSMPIEVVVSPYLSDANDWFLIVDPVVEAPLHLWERSAPDFVPRLADQDNLSTKLNVDFAIAVDSGPQPDGIYGSSVT